MSALSNISRHPSLTYYYAQKALRSPQLRDSLGAAVARIVGPGDQQREATPGAAEVADKLDRDGICFLPQLQLGPETLGAIRQDLADKPVVDWYDGHTSFQLDEVPRDYRKLSYRTGDLVNCMPLLRLANSPLVLDAVTRVLGARPTIGWFESWWTFGEHYSPDKTYYDDIYHRDVDDLRFIKLFAYLTDTDASNGAHSFVRGSHHHPAFTRRGPISDAEVHATFPPEDIMTVTGQAGTVFLENTWGIHRPLLATQGRRLIFSALYALTPWVPRKESAQPGDRMPPGFDRYVNRMLFRQA